jgi:hypothetical protein
VGLKYNIVDELIFSIIFTSLARKGSNSVENLLGGSKRIIKGLEMVWRMCRPFRVT